MPPSPSSPPRPRDATRNPHRPKPHKTGRAAPLSPDERRDALVAAYIAFATDQGRAPTTRELASTAGIAEGTIFRVYPTKDDLALDAVHVADCPVALHAELSTIDPNQSLTDVLIELVTLSQARVRRLFALVVATGLPRPPHHDGHAECIGAGRHIRPEGATDPGATAPSAASSPSNASRNTQLLAPVVAIVEAHRDELRIEPAEAVRLVRMLAISALIHAHLDHEPPLTPERVVDTVLHGVLASP